MTTQVCLNERRDPPKLPNAQRNGPALRVLIVDDDPDTTDTMALLLQCWGLDATVVHDGFEALQAVKADCPDLVLLDLAMPGMDGLDLAKRLREQQLPGSKFPFLVAISGYGDLQTCGRSREAGTDLHLVKPVNPSELQALLERFQNAVVERARSWVANRDHAGNLTNLRHCLAKAKEIRTQVRGD
jgi:CheY-like chemotaxis protein